jgi:ribonuclease HI
MATEFELFFTKEKEVKKQSAQSWVPPEGDMLKINIDGAYAAEKHNGGWGFIIRNSDGHSMGAGAGHIPYAYDALQTEAVACLASLQNAQMWGMMKVQVETDSQLLVQAIKGRNQDMAVNGSLFREINFFASLNFSMFEIKYCPRSCNKVADALANYGAKLGQSNAVIWPEDTPEFVNVLLASDFAVLDM